MVAMKDGVLRWGICSAGKISNDFVVCLTTLPKTEHQVISVAARDAARAQAFASSYSIPKSYGSYEELASDPDLDIVYIGSVHTEHFRQTKMMLEAGKHVLCEKPMCVTVAQTKALCALAKSKKLFFMEGVWSRFFPAYAKVKELIKSGVIGDITHVNAQFGEYSSDPLPRVILKETAGGALMDRGIYPVQFAQFVFDDEKPLEQHSFGTFYEESGVDGQCYTYLRYSNNRTAVLGTSILANLPNEATVSGNKGTIKLCFPIWCATKVEVSLNFGEPKTYEFDLPFGPDDRFNFRNCQGFAYEATQVRECIMKGLLECPVVTHEASLRIAEINQKARFDIGYDLPQDKEVIE